MDLQVNMPIHEAIFPAPSGASAASLVELLGVVLGDPDATLAVSNQFPTLEDLARANNVELEDIARCLFPSGQGAATWRFASNDAGSLCFSSLLWHNQRSGIITAAWVVYLSDA